MRWRTGPKESQRPHLPSQRDQAVVRSSPEYSVEGKKELQKTPPHCLGIIPRSQAIHLLLAVVLQHAFFPMPQRPPQPGAQPSTIGEASNLPAFPKQMRAGRTLQCHVPECAQAGDVLTRALATKPALRLHQGGNALPCPADMEAAGTRPRRARQCLQ